MKNIFRFCIFLLCFIPFTTRVNSVEFRTGESVTIPEETVVEGNLFASGNDIVVNGDVTGDLVCAGKNVTVTGSVEGDILCVAQAITVSGDVGGSIRTVSQNLSLDGSVNRNITSVGQNIGISKDVGGDVFVAASQIVTEADIAGSLYAAAETIKIGGSINRNVHVTVDSLNVGGSASIAGTLTYESQNDATIAFGSTIRATSHIQPESKGVDTKEKKWIGKSGFEIGKKILSLLFVLGFGILFIIFFPRDAVRIQTEMEGARGASLGVGIVSIIAGFICMILFALTIIGIPVTLLIGILFAFFLFISRLSVALVIGKRTIEALNIKNQENLFLQMTAGMVLTWLLFLVPIAGGLLKMILCVWAFGAIVRLLFLRKGK